MISVSGHSGASAGLVIIGISEDFLISDRYFLPASLAARSVVNWVLLRRCLMEWGRVIWFLGILWYVGIANVVNLERFLVFLRRWGRRMQVDAVTMMKAVLACSVLGEWDFADSMVHSNEVVGSNYWACSCTPSKAERGLFFTIPLNFKFNVVAFCHFHHSSLSSFFSFAITIKVFYRCWFSLHFLFLGSISRVDGPD